MSTKQENLAAVLEAPGIKLTTIARPIPVAREGEILVRNYAIAANPVDWANQDYGVFIKKYPAVLGSDVCGIVTAIGPGVTKFKIGDRVAGFAGVIYNQNPDHGAWQTYTLLREVVTMPLPDALSFEEGATFPMAFATAAMAFFVNLKLPRPTGTVKQLESGILIWGAASSIGTAAIQLAKNMGYKVFATASPHNHQYLKSIGAYEVLDYRDPDVVTKIAALAKAVGTPISIGFDAIAKGDSSILSVKTLLASGGKDSRLVLSYEWPTEHAKPDDVEISMPIAFHVGTEQTEIGRWLFNEYLPRELEKRNIMPAPRIEVIEGGIGAAQEALDRVRAGVSGTKIVVRVI